MRHAPPSVEMDDGRVKADGKILGILAVRASYSSAANTPRSERREPDYQYPA